MAYTLGSLFDGSGGFPLAGTMCGIEPRWAAEVEPYPIAVTRSRFPSMKHFGDVSKINGAEIEPVDVITFGSPCQDLSVAGKRAGLKHEANGDEETTRSGLFMEAVRIIKEMREATDGKYPSFALWENVPGAFSSNKGEDFRIVCEELIKIVEPGAVMPQVPASGWAYADSYVGDGWSLSYRVFDAQYWGVPQRRRRIHLVLDLRGERAREVLFEREGVRGYFETGRAPWQGTAADVEGCTGADDRGGEPLGFHLLQDPIFMEGGTPCLTAGTKNGAAAIGVAMMFEPRSMREENWTEQTAKNALRAEASKSSHVIVEAASFLPETGGNDSARSIAFSEELAPCLRAGFTPAVVTQQAVSYAGTYQKVTGPLMANSHPGSYCGQDAYTDMLVVGKTAPNPIAIDRAFFNQGVNAQYDPQIYEDGTVSTLTARGPSAVCVRYIVRRLTPTECARLQGFADHWGEIDQKDSLTSEEFQFWLDVRNTHALINGREAKEYTKAQMLNWYNKLHTDSAEYKMWGNGIALPPALYCMQGITDALEEVEDDWML